MIPLLGALACSIAIAAAMGGCKSSLKTADTSEARGGKTVVTHDPVDTMLAQLDPEFTITHTHGRTYLLSFAVGAGGASGSPSVATVRRIVSFSVQIFAPDGKQLASLATQDINTSGMPNTETNQISLTAAGGVEWEATSDLAPGTYAVMSLQSDRGSVVRRLGFPGAELEAPSARKSIVMTLESEDRAGGVEFILTARRVAQGPDDEYLPSGEKFRIELRSSVNETIWSSSDGKMFTMAIGPVEPDEVGEEVVYRVLWDGRSDLTHSRATPGSYTIMATIPAKPTPYILREEFTWSGR